jgi:deoxyribodipyrimidine photolyase-related protein
MTVTVWVLGDQLLLNHPALRFAEEQVGRENVIVLMIESQLRANRLPYQKKKLVLLFSSMRHYAENLRMTGVRVDYHTSPDLSTAIKRHLREFQPEKLITMAACEYGGLTFQKSLSERFDTPAKILPNRQFLTGRYNPIPQPKPHKRYVQEQFYRKMRLEFDLLMLADGEPVGGRWNYDKSNRRRLPKDEKPDPQVYFKPDEITLEVMGEVEQKFQGVGQIDGFNLAVTHNGAKKAAFDFFEKRLPDFGAYEDAMSSKYETIYHSRLSPYLNLGLLDPLWLAQEAQRRYVSGNAPINSVEGFIRQVVGWREYIYWQYMRLGPELIRSNFWQAEQPLPAFFWTGKTELNCLRHVIHRVLSNGYAHHIERLMVICNFCLLAGIAPVEVNEWFLSTFIDAYEWVMLPNVFGMGLYADGGLTATKPYIASANYINKMSDYCRDCVFYKKKRVGERACPFNYLYWNFILEHEEILKSNSRMSRSLLSLRHLNKEERILVQKQARNFLKHKIQS